MKNNATRTIRSEEITIDVRICAALAANRSGEVYLAAIAPDMELTIITLDETPDILPCFDEDKGETIMEFFNSAIEVLQTLVVALGAGLGVWGAINLLEGYGNDNPGSNAHVR